MTEIKRRTRRLFAALLGLLMALSLLSTTAFAEDGAASIVVTMSSITNVPKDELKQIQVTPYLVLDQVNPDETEEEKKQYEVTQAFKSFFDHQDKAEPEEGFTSGLDAIFQTVAADKTVYLTYNEAEKKLIASASAPENPETKYIEYIEVSGGALDQTYPEAELLSRIQKNEDKRTLYSWIEKYIKAASVPAATSATKENDGTSITISGLNEGYYALQFANVPDGVSVTQGILIPTKSPDGAEMELKYELIPLDKGVKNEAHDTETVTEPIGDNTTASVGDVLSYEIDTKIPTLSNTENLTVYKLEDTMENQQLTGTMTLTLTKDNDKIEFKAQVPADPNTPVYFTRTNDENSKIAKLTISAYAEFEDGDGNADNNISKQSFIVDFLPMTDDIPPVVETAITTPLTNYQGYDVNLAYSAELTTDAVQINDNDVTLKFDNGDSTSEQTDHTEVYTYGIEVQKTFSDGGNNYSAVTFSLYTNDEYEKYKNEQESRAMTLYGSDGNYKTDGTATGVTSLELNTTTGKLTITGLDEGAYWLVENTTDTGYTASEPIKIVLAADANNKAKLDDAGTSAMINGQGDDLATVDSQANTSISLAKFDVLNQKGFNLPQTGGAGTWMFTIGGILLVAAAGVLFVLSRKKDGSK